jgi:protein TonB
LKSSGDSRLDRAALDAVKRAGRFPAAPQGFSKATMTFDLPVSFVR